MSPRELRGIRAEGLLTRFAVLGPVGFASVEIPAEGSAGTGLERHTETEAWGLVLRGQATLHAAAGSTVFPVGSAFHVPPGVEHWFTAPGRAVIAGFTPMPADTDVSDAGFRARGFEVIQRVPPPPRLPARISPAGATAVARPRGSIEVEVAEMGPWMFSRATFGALSGYTSGWCDLPHWGMVLSGDLALRFEDEVELLTAGDVYYCPPGPPGHQFRVADAATTIDYTPITDLSGPGRKASWRITAVQRLAQSEPALAGPARARQDGGRKPSTERKAAGSDAVTGAWTGAPARGTWRPAGLRWARATRSRAVVRDGPGL